MDDTIGELEKKIKSIGKLENEIMSLKSVNAELVEALKYAKRFLKEGEVDMQYIDSALAKVAT